MERLYYTFKTNWQWLLIFCCLCSIGLWAHAQTTVYEVTANTFLNIRSHASVDAPILGTIDKGGQVEVYDITNGWAKISYDGGYAYVSADYLMKVENPATDVKPSVSTFKFPSWRVHKHDVKWIVIVILGMSIALFFIRKNRGEEPLEDGIYLTNWILFLSVSVLELVYLSFMGSDAIWFCIPDQVGWIWTIIDFLVFGFVVYNQYMCFFNTLDDVSYNSNGFFDRRWGIYSWIGGIIAVIVSGIFFPSAVPIVLVIFAICQLIQVILIFKSIVPESGWGNAFLCAAVYVLGSLSTVLILAHFVVLLIIVIIGYFLLSLLGKSSSSSGRCSSCSHYSSGYCHYLDRSINSPATTRCDHYS